MTTAPLEKSFPAGSRIPSIDVLRGLAVILVVLHHIHLRFKLNHFDVATLLPQPVGQVFFWSGYYAVIAFFVISGFLITSLSLRRWGTLDNISPPAFYRLRVARILPCLLLLLAVLSALHLAGCADFFVNPERASLTRVLVAALTFHINWLEGTRGYLPGSWDVLWSLSVEEVFYLGFPLLCLVLRRERWVLLGMVALIVIGPVNRTMLEGREPWSEYAYLSCMDGIAFGCLAAWISARTRTSRPVLRVAMVLGVVAVALVLVVCRTPAFDPGLSKVGLDVTILELGVALMLYALANGVGTHALSRGTGLIQLVGRSSYEIYLTHMFVVLGLMHPFKALFGASPRGSTYPIAYLIMLALSIVLGVAASRWYSEPLNFKLRRR
ncbi:MAG TPA: acyltransferase [Steroidobacteraceae bacterium]|jgi:peptidoglycan/LPS O-acetylase OafA/YrhL|nr:acyltransferase [Steroidobacteraceae bacterium]